MAQRTMGPEQFKKLIAEAVAKALDDKLEPTVAAAVAKAFADVGLRVDEPDHVDEGREDFRFLRRMREAYDSAAGKIGGFVILTMVAGLLGLIWTGLQLALATKTGAPPR
jgi:hypothetical protein